MYFNWVRECKPVEICKSKWNNNVPYYKIIVICIKMDWTHLNTEYIHAADKLFRWTLTTRTSKAFWLLANWERRELISCVTWSRRESCDTVIGVSKSSYKKYQQYDFHLNILMNNIQVLYYISVSVNSYVGFTLLQNVNGSVTITQTLTITDNIINQCIPNSWVLL